LKIKQVNVQLVKDCTNLVIESLRDPNLEGYYKSQCSYIINILGSLEVGIGIFVEEVVYNTILFLKDGEGVTKKGYSKTVPLYSVIGFVYNAQESVVEVQNTNKFYQLLGGLIHLTHICLNHLDQDIKFMFVDGVGLSYIVNKLEVEVNKLKYPLPSKEELYEGIFPSYVGVNEEMFRKFSEEFPMDSVEETAYRNQNFIPKFWFNYKSDYRGRVYANLYHLSYQSDKFIRGCTELPEPRNIIMNDKVIEDCFLMIGDDSLSREERIEDGFNAYQEFLESGANPFGKKELWKFKVMLDLSRGDLSKTVVWTDATNSGIQLLSYLTSDIEGLKESNLLNSGERKDFYKRVAMKMSEILGEEISRKSVKLATMVHYYNGGDGIVSQKLSEEGLVHEKYLITFNKAVKGLMVTAEELMIVLKDIINSQQRYEFKWTLPNGKKVSYKNRIDEVSKVEIPLTKYSNNSNCSITVTRKIYGFGKKCSSGFLPNVIHSLDGYVLSYVVQKMNELKKEVYTVHDSFGISIEDISLVKRLYLEGINSIPRDYILRVIKEVFGVEVTNDFTPFTLDGEYYLY